MKYFLTGATGFVGGELARQLRLAGHDVIALVRNLDKAAHLQTLGITLAKGDVTDKESMRAPMQGCDGVFHVAGWYKVGARDKTEGQKINIDGTRHVLELMQELGIRKGVYTSTLAVNSDTHGNIVDEDYHFNGAHISEYDRTKAAAHQLAADFIAKGLPLVILMPGLIYGPGGQSLSDKALVDYFHGRLPVIPSKSAFCWAHVEDIANAHILAMEKAENGSKYIIAGPPYTLVEALHIAKSITGKRVPFVVPPVMLRLTGLFSALIERIIPLPEMYTSEALRVQAGVTYLGSNARAQRDLGYAPRDLKAGFEDLFSKMK